MTTHASMYCHSDIVWEGKSKLSGKQQILPIIENHNVTILAASLGQLAQIDLTQSDLVLVSVKDVSYWYLRWQPTSVVISSEIVLSFCFVWEQLSSSVEVEGLIATITSELKDCTMAIYNLNGREVQDMCIKCGALCSRVFTLTSMKVSSYIHPAWSFISEL